MTEATPLASEQITQEDREAAAKLYEWFRGLSSSRNEALKTAQFIRDGGADGWTSVQHFARHRIAALSASPAPSAALHDHVRKMQEACANYLEPTTYIARHPDTSRVGDCAWVREFPMPDQHSSAQGAAEANARRDQAFIRDMIYMLDGPEQRAAMAPAPSGQGVSGEVGDQFRRVPNMMTEAQSVPPVQTCAISQTAAPAPSCAPGEVAALVQRLFDKRWASSSGEWGVPDWVETDEPRRVAEQILAALSPQGLDAKEGGE